MPSSPTIENITYNFDKMKRKLGIENKDIIKHYYIILLLYPFIVLSFLLWFRQTIILENNNKDEKCICYKKLIMWFILLQVPLFLYYLLNQKKLVG